LLAVWEGAEADGADVCAEVVDKPMAANTKQTNGMTATGRERGGRVGIDITERNPKEEGARPSTDFEGQVYPRKLVRPMESCAYRAKLPALAKSGIKKMVYTYAVSCES